MATTKKTKKDYIQTVGRRKTSTARVRLFLGEGTVTVNDMPAEEYFPGETLRAIYMRPFSATGTEGVYYATVKCEGGGIHSQAEAVAHGIARALVERDATLKSVLRIAGVVTRDPRMKERRKPGLAQSARAKKSSPKR